MSPALALDDDRRRSLNRVLRAWLAQRPQPSGRVGPGGAPAAAADLSKPAGRLLAAELLRPGRPGLLDVLAEVDGRTAHLVLGLRRPGEEQHFLGPGDEAVLGLVDDGTGTAVVVDALLDAELAPLALEAVTGRGGPQATSVAVTGDDGYRTVVSFGSALLTVFGWPGETPDVGVDLLVALDDAGFNHLAAPVARWQRGGRDLGLVQEMPTGATRGWAVAATSLRDLYGTGGPPEDAGGDFGPESRALGVMTARLHLACDRAFGRRSEPVAGWVDQVEATVAAADPLVLEGEGLVASMAQLRRGDLRGTTLRTHGDLHLGRVARTDQGWVVVDGSPGGCLEGAGPPAFRSPLADVADLLWSLHHAASVAAAERDPSGRMGLGKLAHAWESYNRRAFLAGYLATPGIGGLVPADREVTRSLAALFELRRAVAGRSAR